MVLGLIEELRSVHGDRFVLDAKDDIREFWDVDNLRRALWNLAVNGVKYGAPDKVITIRLSFNNQTSRPQVLT